MELCGTESQPGPSLFAELLAILLNKGHLPGAWGCRHRRRQGFAAIFRSDAPLPDWLEGGGGPLANTSSQKPESLEHGQLKTQERQEHKSAMRHGSWWPGSARGIVRW